MKRESAIKCSKFVVILMTLVTVVGSIQLNPISTQSIIAGDVFFEITDPPELEYTYRLRPAKNFGTSFSKRLENVPMVATEPLDACTTITNKKNIKGNVALIERGECSFLTKTIRAEEAGAVAVIITEFNNRSSEFDFYIEMIHDNTNRDAHIPAGFLLGKNGIVIHSTLRKLKRQYALVNLPVNLTFTPPAKINHPPWLECSFLTKTIRAEEAGAVAVIITEFNNRSSEFDFYIEMIHDNTNRDAHIPAGFLLGKNGIVIHSTLRKLKRQYALVNLPVNLTFTPPAKINHPPWLGW